MSLTPGSRLGPYEIVSPIGAGGMGEVYRARDARLGRDVAVKVLPDDVAGDPKTLARFESEARAVAALSHPNILALFDVGEAGGVRYVVTELLEGETLRTALRQGALPIRRTLEVGQQIAEGLAAAHAKGIVHRDVKPENIFITADGHAKLLDFGLARQSALASDPGLASAPTAAALTDRGVVAGTVAYMSPEQASARPVDHRSDQFSLGVVLFEMLACKRPFAGATVAETLTAIIRDEPAPLEVAGTRVAAPVRWLIDRLLTKEPGGRYDSTGDLARDLGTLRLHIAEATSSGTAGAGIAAPRVSRRRVVAWASAALGVVAVVVTAGVAFAVWTAAGHPPANVSPPTFQRLTAFDGIETWPSLSPDGRTVVYQKSVGGKTDIYSLRVGGKNPTNLTAGLDGDQSEPAFSPDGRRIAFRSEAGRGGIFVMEATGESANRLTDFGHVPAWFPDGKRIAIATEAPAEPSNVTTMSELWVVDLESRSRRNIPGVRVYQPSVSPHGRRIAYWTVRPGGGGQRDIYTISTGQAAAGSPVAVTNDAALDWNPLWSGDGRFLYFASDRGGTMNLWRIAIDEESGKAQGEPEPVTVPVTWAGPFRATPDASRVVFTSVDRERTLERVSFDPAADRTSGAFVPLRRFGNQIGWLHVAPPRGDLLTLQESGRSSDILVAKTDGAGVRNLTDDGYRNWRPSFSPDGTKVVFHSDRSGTYDLWIINADGSGLTPFTRSTTGNVKNARWSPDGRTIAANDMSGHPLLLPFPRSVEDPMPEPGPLPGPGLSFQPYSWSHDSRNIVAAYSHADGSTSGIVIYDVETKSYRHVAGTGRAPEYLRDGRIAFLDGAVLKIVDIATGRTAEALRGDLRHRIDAFAFSPDNRSLYVAWAGAQADLWLMDLGGKR